MTMSGWLRSTALLAVLAAAGGSAARADDPAPAPGAPGSRESLLDKALGALRVRMEAKLKEAELLERAGKIDEALAATRDVDRLYRETLADLQRLFAAAGSGGALPAEHGKVRVPVPPSEEDEMPFSEPDGMDNPEPGLIAPDAPPGPFPGRRVGAPTDAGRARADAVFRGLRWLAAHQSEDGGWEAAGFDRWCDGKPNLGAKPDGPGKATYDVGVTGLALCSFLGAGYTNRGDHEFAKAVRKGLNYLKNVQDVEGCFGARSTQHFVYNHACASLAMVEAYGMTESRLFKASAQKALDFIALCRNPYFVWRYGVKPGDNDSAVTGWMMMALKSAGLINADAARRGKAAPLVVDEEAFEGVRAWFDKMTDRDLGRVGYLARGQGPARPQELVDRFPPDKSEAMTAVGMLARIFLHEDPAKSPVLRKGADLCLRLLPTWNPHDGSIDMVYWYYATLALFQVGGEAWSRWDRALETAVVATQRSDGRPCDFQGSWDPVDPWGPEGGRVYSTALLTMCCEVSWRYARVFAAR